MFQLEFSVKYVAESPTVDEIGDDWNEWELGDGEQHQARIS